MKKLLPYLLFLFTVTGYAQNNSVFKTAISANADSTTVRNTVAASQSYYSNIGALYYNRQSSKWRIFSDSTWSDLIQPAGGGGLSQIYGYNGLTTVGTDSIRLGGTLTQNTSIIQAGFNTTFSGIGKVTFSPTTGGGSVAGLNVGSIAGAPTTLANADLWYNSTAKYFQIRADGATYTLQPSISSGLSNARVPFSTVSAGLVYLIDDSGFTFSTTGDVLTVGSLTALTTATLPAVNLGSLAGDPSTLSNGSLWYSSSTNSVRARVNGASTNLLNGALTSGRVTYASGGGTVTDDADLTFDGTNLTLNGGQTTSYTTDKISRQIITFNGLTGTIAAGGNFTGAFPPLTAFPNNSVIEFEVTVTGIQTDGTNAFSVKKSALFRVDNAGTLTMDVEDATTNIKETTAGIISSGTFSVLTGNPAFNILRGATVGNFTYSSIGIFTVRSL